MLCRSLEQFKLICLLHSRFVRNALVEVLLPRSRVKIHDELIYACKRQLHFLSNDSWRQNENNIISEQCINENFLNLDLLNDFFKHFFTIDGAYLYAKTNHAEEYSAICRDVHPYCILAYGLATKFLKNEITLNNLEKLSENITEVAVKHEHKQVFAENHLHFGGANNNNANLLKLIEIKKYNHIDAKKLPENFRFKNTKFSFKQSLAIYREIAYFFNKILHNENELKEPAIKKIKTTLEDINNDHYIFKKKDANTLGFYAKLQLNYGSNNNAAKIFKLGLKQYKKGYSDSALLLLLTSLYIFQKENKKFTDEIDHLLTLFIHQLNIFRSVMVMESGNGLAHFVEYYGSKLRKIGNQDNYIEPARNIFIGGTKRVEFRSGDIPKNMALKDTFYEIAKTLTKKHEEYSLNHEKQSIWREIPHPSQSLITFNCGLHFTKNAKDEPKKDRLKKDKHPVLKNYRYYNKYQEIEKKTNEIINFIHSNENKILFSEIFKGRCISPEHKKELEKFTLDKRLLLRTIDAAGDENLYPPEVFAPFARSLRTNTQFLKSGALSKKAKQLTLAFHAGECFNHIVTGMRRVDETIKFMKYQENDRLGHALAIGINPLDWIKEKNELIINKTDLFDNYIWLWQKSIEMTQIYPPANKWTDFYGNKAEQIARELYPNIGFKGSLNNFYKAWLMRKNHPGYLNKKNHTLFSSYVPYEGKNENVTEEIYETYLYKKYKSEIADETVTFRYDHFFKSHDKVEIITEEECNFWEAIQDYMLRKCTEKGIIIEANPSSNIYIAELDRYKKHPIFRWHPINERLLKGNEKYNKFNLRKGPIKVCTNTDDPSIFPTTIQNEFKLLKNSAIEQHEFTNNEIDCWIENLRKIGIKIFEDNYINPFDILHHN